MQGNQPACTVCGEHVFERYFRFRDGTPCCIPYSRHKG